MRGRIVDLSGLISSAQVLALAQAEIAGLAPDETIMIAVAAR
jgi:hypothetical protein